MQDSTLTVPRSLSDPRQRRPMWPFPGLVTVLTAEIACAGLRGASASECVRPSFTVATTRRLSILISSLSTHARPECRLRRLRTRLRIHYAQALFVGQSIEL
ncbi:hypothetical protein B0J13DRAFT_523985 [Dactylonectria estremocensis]|uniref:Uncharacterized protein n=1 Tax=Dactylonectria estremocensis TaxID=1079267 RepID=A0A9P9J8H7_9HYPO|nr:hypothetical protein B0J13DRAFT_523985 [Dactylonectria estremocensis]